MVPATGDWYHYTKRAISQTVELMFHCSFSLVITDRWLWNIVNHVVPNQMNNKQMVERYLWKMVSSGMNDDKCELSTK